jgi:hypothetical protein
VYDPKFGVKLYHDGRIETNYYTTSISTDWNWIAGVSKGDMKTHTLPDINNLPIMLGGFRINYTMNKWPSWLYFSEGGALLGVPDDGEARVFLPVRVEDDFGLSKTKTYSLHINGTSGSDDIQNNTSVELFPNPFTNRINIKLENIVSEKIQFDLFSIDGKKVISREYFTRGAMNIDVDLSELESSGNFFYQLHTGSKVYSGKVVRMD